MKLSLSLLTFVLSILLALQVYSFFQFHGYLRDKIKPRLAHATVFFGTAVFLISMLVPLVSPGLTGGAGMRSLHGYFNAAQVWSIGSFVVAVLLLYSLIRGADPFCLRFSRLPRIDLRRRKFLRQSAGAAAAAPFVFAGYSAQVKRRRFAVEHFTVPIEGLSTALGGFTIVQLTDIHVGPFMSADKLAVFVEATNRLSPDLIALTGDFIAGSREEVAPCVATLAKLKARYGVYACIGNHEIHAKAADLLTEGLEASGIRVLRNDGISVPVGSAHLSILGIDDLGAGRPDFNRAMAAIQKSGGEAKILLSHRPEIFPAAARAGVDLVLSGHYHGGQVKFGRYPKSLSIARLLTPYSEGLFQLPRKWRRHAVEHRRSTLFVGRGVGISGIPVRINCAPQIAHLTLNKA